LDNLLTSGKTFFAVNMDSRLHL